MVDLPTGTVTFMFTDIEGSTQLWEQSPAEMKAATARHDAIVEEQVARHGGIVVRPRGEGDSRFAVFARASDAVAAATALQEALYAEVWPTARPVRVRLALHTGEADLRGGDYYGAVVNRCARLRAIAHGGQTLVSQTTGELVRGVLPGGTALRDLGEHRLKDLDRPDRVFQLLSPGLPSDFPPLRSLDLLPNNLPLQLTSFVGREREQAEVRRLLATARLLTLTGTGGCGKTRLALQVGAELADAFADGVWFVDLAPLADPALVPQAVASALGVHEVPGRSLRETLADSLRRSDVLLILDNCEHLLDACAQLADALLRACPRLRILATSRELLGIAGENAWRVPSLTLPDARQTPAVAGLTQYDAVRLFIDRALAALPTFAVTNQNAPAVAQLCWRLDGIPLAIELAAARVRVLTVEQIAARLDDRFRLLTGGSRTALRRQQTLQAAVDWSYQLLSEAERLLLQRLAVFAGGWTLEAAEAVGTGERIAGSEVLDLLAALVDKSLVVAEGQGAHARYRLLETIRQYAGEKLLEAGKVGLVRDRHRDWYAGLAARGEPEPDGPVQEEWLGRLEAEHDNLLAALAWSLEGDLGVGLRLATSLGGFWGRRGYIVEGRRWLEAFLAQAPATNDPEDQRVRARALRSAGVMASDQQDRGAAWAFLDESLTLFRALGDQRGVAAALKNQGIELLRGGATAERIQATLEESLALWRALGDQFGVADTLQTLSFLAARERDDARARRLMDEALPLYRASGRSVVYVLVERGWFAWGRGDLARAWRDLEEGLGIARRVGIKGAISLALLALGCLALEEGERGRARASLEESARLLQESGMLWVFYLGLAYLGHRAVNQGRYVPGVRLLAAAEAVYPGHAIIASLQPLAHPAERAKAVAAGRTALGEEAFAAAWAEGQRMTLEQAVAVALED
jgi:predicted ATPase/class 3 adenylate cyclase